MIDLITTAHCLLLGWNAEILRQVFLSKVRFQVLLDLIVAIARRKRPVVLRPTASRKEDVMLGIRLADSLVSHAFPWV